MKVCYQEQDGICSSILLLVANLQFHLAPVSKSHQICIKCNKADIWLRTPDDGQKDCTKHVGVITSIKLEFSASVGFIHKEFVTMHGHTI